MECEHFYIYSPHRVCCKCGEVDEECILYPTSDFYSESNLGQNDTTQTQNEQKVIHQIPGRVRYDHGKIQKIYLSGRLRTVFKDGYESKCNYAKNMIKKVFGNMDLDSTLYGNVATDICFRWFKDKRSTGHFKTVIYAAIWYSIRYNNYPMTFKRYVHLLKEYGEIQSNKLGKDLFKFLHAVDDCFPKAQVPVLADKYITLIQHDRYYNRRIHQLVKYPEIFFEKLRDYSVKIANKVEISEKKKVDNKEIQYTTNKIVGSNEIIALVIVNYTAQLLHKYFEKKEAMTENVDVLLTPTHFEQLFSISGTYISRKVDKFKAVLQNSYMEVKACIKS